MHVYSVSPSLSARRTLAPCAPTVLRHRVALVCLAWVVPFTAAAQPAPASEAGPRVAEQRLREVVVSGSRSERALEDVPTRIDVLSDADLDPAAVQDIRDLVRHVPNVSVQRAPKRFGAVMGSGGRAGNAGFNIRGLEGNRILLTIDGIRVPRAFSAGVIGAADFGRDHHDLGLISRVEIVRTASSALYGSDGLGGMVAMFTTEPKELIPAGQSLGGRMVLRHASEDRHRGLGLTLAGAPSDTLQWLGSVQAGRSSELDSQGSNHALNASRTAPNPQQDKSLALLGKLVLTPGAGHQHTLTLERVDKSSQTEVYSGREAVAAGFRTLDLDADDDSQRTRLSWDGRFKLASDWADELRATVAYQRSKAQQVTLEQQRRVAAPNDLRSRSRDLSYSEKTWQTVLQAEKTRPLGAAAAHKLVYGVDLMASTMDSLLTGLIPPAGETFPTKRFPRTRETTASAFVQSEFITERWSVIPALRYDRFDLRPDRSPLFPVPAASLSGSAWSPKLGVIFRPVADWSVFGNLASGFRAPSPLQLNAFFENLTGFAPYRTLPNPNLKPESGRTLEIGTRARAGALNWEAAVFTGRYKDFIDEGVQVSGLGTLASPSTFQSVNRGRVRLSGFELKGALALGPNTDLRLAYGQTQGRDTRLNQPLNSVNPAQLMLGVDQKRGPWTLGTRLTHVAKKSISDIHNTLPAGQVPFAPKAYTTLDLKAGWQVRQGVRLNATVHNVTNRKHWEWTQVRAIHAASPVLDAFTAPGRSFALALVADF